MSEPPEKESPRFAAEGSKETSRLTDTLHVVGMQGRARCEDQWIRNYLTHLEALDVQFGDGAASTRTVLVAMRAYDTFRSSCDPLHRFAAWEAIRLACRLFSRLSRRN
jgi:hypothetical protein